MSKAFDRQAHIEEMTFYTTDPIKAVEMSYDAYSEQQEEWDKRNAEHNEVIAEIEYEATVSLIMDKYNCSYQEAERILCNGSV